MKRSTVLAMSAVGVVCALGGAAAGIAESSASSTKGPRVRPLAIPFAARIARAHGLMLLGAAPLKIAAGAPVHSESVVPNEKGGFDTVTMDRGSFVSLSGDQLTIKEGTDSATYKEPTLTIPSNATVRRNADSAQLSDLKAGDKVIVLQSPSGTTVLAHDAQHEGPLKSELLKPGPPGALKPGEGGPKVDGAGPVPAPLEEAN